MVIYGDFLTTLSKALSEIEPQWQSLPGLIVCGTHDPTNPEDQIEAIRKARLEGTPFLGICFGHQLAAIEYARNVQGISDATSEEWGEGTFVVVKRKQGLNVGLKDGETFWNNYEVNFSWENPKNFITVQYHPEYQSSKDNPHPILVQFINICKQYANH